MKSAKEMFEELGYDMYAHKHSIEYVNWEEDKHIWFYLTYKTKTVEIGEFDINIKELQAINKQVEELWGGNDA